jgi:hypothetical protein
MCTTFWRLFKHRLFIRSHCTNYLSTRVARPYQPYLKANPGQSLQGTDDHLHDPTTNSLPPSSAHAIVVGGPRQKAQLGLPVLSALCLSDIAAA